MALLDVSACYFVVHIAHRATWHNYLIAYTVSRSGHLDQIQRRHSLVWYIRSPSAGFDRGGLYFLQIAMSFAVSSITLYPESG